MSTANLSVITPIDAKCAAFQLNEEKAKMEYQLRDEVKQAFITEKNEIIKHINANLIHQIANGESKVEFTTDVKWFHYDSYLFKYNLIGREKINKTITDQLGKECGVFGEFIKAAGYNSNNVFVSGSRDENYNHLYSMQCKFTINM